MDSEAINQLDYKTECFFHRLLLIADDEGRFDARPQLLRSKLFPLSDSFSAHDAEECLQQCERHGLLTLYTIAAKPYGEIRAYGQRLRVPSVFPPPPQNAAECRETPQNAAPETATETVTETVEEQKTATEAERKKRWFAAMTSAHPALVLAERFSPAVIRSAREAYVRMPTAYNYAPLLTAYMADKLPCDSRGKPFHRPEKAEWFFQDLENIIVSAQRWARETGFGKPKPKPKPTPQQAEEKLTPEQEAELERLKKELNIR